MPVRLTMGQLAVDMRLTADETDIPAPYMGILTRSLQTARETVEAYAPTAPQDTLDTATARMAGYIVDSPTYARMPSIAFRNSGCQSLLSRWHVLIGETV